MFSVSAAAEFYKYVDEDGNVHFTDDINQVPAEQRAKIRSYVESVSEDPAEQEVTRENQSEQAAADQQTNFPDLSGDESENLEDAKKRINELKSEIDQEYEALLKEKEQLAKNKEKAKTREQIVEFNKKVDSLNRDGEYIKAIKTSNFARNLTEKIPDTSAKEQIGSKIINISNQIYVNTIEDKVQEAIKLREMKNFDESLRNFNTALSDAHNIDDVELKDNFQSILNIKT